MDLYTMNSIEIELSRITKRFDCNHVLSDVSFRVRPGESFALIGKSGVGKSVALKIMLGLLQADSGEVLLGGRGIAECIEDFRQSSGVLFQGGALFDSLPVWKNVAFSGLKGARRVDSRQARKAAEEKLERVGLDVSIVEQYPSELSGGMQRRVGIARALYGEPRVLFFDEPTTGLDPVRAARITELISGILADSRVTAVTISHDMNFVGRVADNAALLAEGRIAWRGSSDEIVDANDGVLGDFVRGRK